MSRPRRGEDYPSYMPGFESHEAIEDFAYDVTKVEPFSEEERKSINRWAIDASNVTFATVNDILTLYSHIVGDEHPEEVERRVAMAGFSNFSEARDSQGLRKRTFDSGELMSLDEGMLRREWRLGSKAWPHTKLRFNVYQGTDNNSRQYVSFYIDPNGVSARGRISYEKRMILDFSDMLEGYLTWRGLLIDLSTVGTK